MLMRAGRLKGHPLLGATICRKKPWTSQFGLRLFTILVIMLVDMTLSNQDTGDSLGWSWVGGSLYVVIIRYPDI